MGFGVLPSLMALFLLLFLACGSDLSITKQTDPPVVEILSPVDGATVLEGEAIVFLGQVDDRQDPPERLAIRWSSDRDGLLDESPASSEGRVSASTASLSVGRHAISLTATDLEAGASVVAIALEVAEPSPVPTLSWVRPLPGDQGEEGADNYLELSLVDADGDPTLLQVEIRSDLDGSLCRPAVDLSGTASCSLPLSPGGHSLLAIATDPDGNVGEAEAFYEVLAASALDRDGDGYSPSGGDCNDADSSVHPNAPEVANEVDDDCDGSTDEGTTNRDDDGDGLSEVEGDCNDATASIFAGAREVCDLLDNNCDGVADNDTECFDDDGDGLTELQGDCNDADPSVAPGLDEHLDGVDEDCDGALDEGTSVYDDDADCVCEVGPCTGSVNGGCASLSDGDCDDGDPTVGPSAPEWCDGVDNNCDGFMDEDSAVDASTWYFDGDQDGYGNGAMSSVACSAPSGWGSDASDCQDQRADIYPGAAESCDGVDNDCDLSVDESDSVDALTWYLDADSDLHGDPAISVLACEAPAGYVALGDDCDDSNGSRNCQGW